MDRALPSARLPAVFALLLALLVAQAGHALLLEAPPGGGQPVAPGGTTPGGTAPATTGPTDPAERSTQPAGNGPSSGGGDPSPPGDGAAGTDPGTPERANATPVRHGLPPGATLISVQSYDGFENNGRALIVGPDGEVLWQYDPPGTRVFDSEMLDNGNVLLATARHVPPGECPEQYADSYDHCVENRVLELDYDTKEVVWEYAWFDAFIHWHEVHDVDRLPGGETAIIDMGNDRTFVVDRDGTVTWSWDATEKLGPGSAFRERYGGPEREGPESDWTHMNDVDLLPDGDFLMSIRNFDSLLEVDRETGEIERVWGGPGAHEVMHEQHNPEYLPERGTVLVADSGNDRVVEVTPRGEIVWIFGGAGLLNWPRDADRLPNGNRLIVDTFKNRVVEVSPEGDIVWGYRVLASENGNRVTGLPYSADRLVAEDGTPLREESATRAAVDAGDAAATPGNGTATRDDAAARDDATAAPGNGTVVPGDATAVPGNATTAPDGATATAGDGAATPSGGTAPVDAGTPTDGTVPEETTADGDATGGTDGTEPRGRTTEGGLVPPIVYRLEAWATFFLPLWVELPELVNGVLLVLVGGALAGQRGLARWRRRGE